MDKRGKEPKVICDGAARKFPAKIDEMTVRDRFAAAALTGFLSSWGEGNIDDLPDMVFTLADAMMKERG